MISTDQPAKRCNLFAHLLGKTVMALCGWKVEGQVPKHSKMVVIAAPHTSNWDFIFFLGTAYSLRLSVHWLGKKEIFIPVFGAFLKYLGGVAVDRSKRSNMVQHLANTILDSNGFALTIPPAGTRRKTDHWKSGFYQIAQAAGIPMVCGYLDYKNKVAGLGLVLTPSGNVGNDMDKIRAFYQPFAGKHPANASDIHIREEANLDAGQSH